MKRILKGSLEQRARARLWIQQCIHRLSPGEIHDGLIRQEGGTWVCSPLGAMIIGFAADPDAAMKLIEEYSVNGDPLPRLAEVMNLDLGLLIDVRNQGSRRETWGKIVEALEEPDAQPPNRNILNHLIQAELRQSRELIPQLDLRGPGTGAFWEKLY